MYGVLCFRVRHHLKKISVAAGVELGRLHAREVAALLDKKPPLANGELLGWDFTGVEVASTSYIKATLLHAVGWGRWQAEALTVLEVDWMRRFGDKPRDVYSFALNANEEVAEAIDDAFARQGWSVLLGKDIISVGLGEAKIPSSEPLEMLGTAELLGEVEPVALKTLLALNGVHQHTALDLHERFAREETISATGWNNRLADLFRARLARRTRQGKSWIYNPLAETVTYGQRISRS